MAKEESKPATPVHRAHRARNRMARALYVPSAGHVLNPDEDDVYHPGVTPEEAKKALDKMTPAQKARYEMEVA